MGYKGLSHCFACLSCPLKGDDPQGVTSKKEFNGPNEATGIRLCSTDTCGVGREGNNTAAFFPSLQNSRLSLGILISTSAVEVHHLYREAGVSKKQCRGIMYSLNQEMPRNPSTGKETQWDSDRLTHTDQ